jgi:AraC family transcriptional regulator
MTTRNSYVSRINRVIDHIDAHLDAPLDLQVLADVAHFSPWHFHRLFQAFTGETLADRVRRRRLEIAAIRLLALPPVTALSIALDVGFGSAEVFSRTFKNYFGVTPSAWRRGAYQAWADARRDELSKIHQAARNARQAIEEVFREDANDWQARQRLHSKGADMNIDIKTFPDVRVAYLRHLGPYGDPGIGRMWQRFAAWCQEKGLWGRETFGLSPDSPDITAPEKCRYDACVAVDASFKPEGEIGVQTIAGGLYACTPFEGTAEQIHFAWMRVYSEWLPESGFQADDRPAVEGYSADFKSDPKTGVFACELRLPVKAL